MNSILEKIVLHKRQEIEIAQRERPLRELQKLVEQTAPPLDFLSAITAGEQADRVSLIAEVKKASPSKGLIRADFDPVSISEAYAANGASCLSVLTDQHFFQGHLDYLRQVRAAVAIPLLRKDFILTEYQVWEARSAGADAVLLIAECLEAPTMKRLHKLIISLKMTPLVELYDRGNIAAVLDCNPVLVGVNNRDLNTFEVNLQHSLDIKRELPSNVAMVSESGIFTPAHVRLMREHAVDAILVGESLMRADDIGAAVRKLLSL